MSSATMTRWFQCHREVMRSMGVKPSQKLLPPKVAMWVCSELGLQESDF